MKRSIQASHSSRGVILLVVASAFVWAACNGGGFSGSSSSKSKPSTPQEPAEEPAEEPVEDKPSAKDKPSAAPKDAANPVAIEEADSATQEDTAASQRWLNDVTTLAGCSERASLAEGPWVGVASQGSLLWDYTVGFEPAGSALEAITHWTIDNADWGDDFSRGTISDSNIEVTSYKVERVAMANYRAAYNCNVFVGTWGWIPTMETRVGSWLGLRQKASRTCSGSVDMSGIWAGSKTDAQHYEWKYLIAFTPKGKNLEGAIHWFHRYEDVGTERFTGTIDDAGNIDLTTIASATTPRLTPSRYRATVGCNVLKGTWSTADGAVTGEWTGFR